MSDYAIIGKSVPKVDVIPKVTGAAKYAGDIVLPRTLCGKILRSPHPHARILNIDTSKAESLIGVKAVITGKGDTAGIRYGLFPGTRDEYAICWEKVRYVGDEVAAVAAVDEDTAEEALDLIEVEYEVLPAVYDPREAMKEGAPQLHDIKPGNKSIVVDIELGDVEKAFRESDHVREDHFDTVAITHCIPETYGALAVCDPRGCIDVWVNNQAPFIKQKALSTTMRIPEHKIRLHRPYLGGAFGSQSEMLKAEFMAAMLARKSREPVRVWLTREETNSGSVRQKHPYHMDLRMGVKKDGTIKVIDIKSINDGGAYISIGAITNVCGTICTMGMYPRLEAYRYHCDRVCTNKPPKGAMRGNGGQQITFAVDSQIDLVARDLGIDPIEMRKKNAARTGDVNPHKSVITSSAFSETMEEAAKASGWKKKVGKLPPYKGIGVGCAAYFHSFDYGYRTSSAAFVKFNEEGEITVFSGNVDNGMGNETMLCSIAAEELGARLEDIRLINGDTLLTPNDPGTHTMSATTTSGMAMKVAAADAKKELFKVAAEELKTDPEQLNSKDGKIFIKGKPSKAITFRNAIRAGLSKGKVVMGKGHFQPHLDPLDWYGGGIMGQMVGGYSYATAIAEVEIDRDTGFITVPKLTVAYDCGKPLNPQIVHGQIQGSAMFCLGQAMYEESCLDEGQVMNPTYLDYGVPTSLQMPDIKTIIVKSDHPDGPFGAKGMDASVHSSNSAIANAVHDAIGVRISSVPVTPEKVLKAIEEKERRETLHK
jgi:4-hydroxybenzoyl-CoA reductase subunit alpha